MEFYKLLASWEYIFPELNGGKGNVLNLKEDSNIYILMKHLCFNGEEMYKLFSQLPEHISRRKVVWEWNINKKEQGWVPRYLSTSKYTRIIGYDRAEVVVEGIIGTPPTEETHNIDSIVKEIENKIQKRDEEFKKRREEIEKENKRVKSIIKPGTTTLIKEINKEEALVRIEVNGEEFIIQATASLVDYDDTEAGILIYSNNQYGP